jgi:hypothetical protein
MNRRKFLAFLAAGGVVTATGLWLPGQKLISVPKKSAGIITTGYFPKAIWPGIQRWFYDHYTDEVVMEGVSKESDFRIVRQRISAEDFYLSDNVTKT